MSKKNKKNKGGKGGESAEPAEATEVAEPAEAEDSRPTSRINAGSLDPAESADGPGLALPKDPTTTVPGSVKAEAWDPDEEPPDEEDYPDDDLDDGDLDDGDLDDSAAGAVDDVNSWPEGVDLIEPKTFIRQDGGVVSQRIDATTGRTIDFIGVAQWEASDEHGNPLTMPSPAGPQPIVGPVKFLLEGKTIEDANADWSRAFAAAIEVTQARVMAELDAIAAAEAARIEAIRDAEARNRILNAGRLPAQATGPYQGTTPRGRYGVPGPGIDGP